MQQEQTLHLLVCMHFEVKKERSCLIGEDMPGFYGKRANITFISLYTFWGKKRKKLFNRGGHARVLWKKSKHYIYYFVCILG